MIGAHSRSAPVAVSAMPAMTTSAASALSAAAAPEVSSGTAARRPNTAGITVTGISISTVAETVGVSSRWNSGSRAASRSGSTDETTTRGRQQRRPPSATAAAQTAMKAPLGPITIR